MKIKSKNKEIEEMEYLTQLDQILEEAVKRPSHKIAVAVAQDTEVLEAVHEAKERGMIDPILTGNKWLMEPIAEKAGIDLSDFEIIDEKDDRAAAARAVELVKKGDADILMKGLVNTDVYLKAILNKEHGLSIGKLLTHVAVFEVPGFSKLQIVSDAAINISPDLSQKIEITNNAVKVAQALGINEPKVAILSATEKVNAEKMPSSGDAALMTQMNRRRQIKGAIIDGPLALDNAVSEESAKIKKIKSPVAGDADILITPNIDAGNVLYKSLIFYAKAKVAATVMGVACPVVLTSRADSKESKLYSIALSALIADLD
jgi:phosphate butyryltransferase